MKTGSPTHPFCIPLITGCLIVLTLAGCGTSPAPADAGPKAPTTTIADRDQPNVITNIGQLPQMARPILILFQAVKKKEPQLLAHVFSSRINKLFRETGQTWPQVLDHKAAAWQKQFGDWHLRDIFFESSILYPPDKGKVMVSFRPPYLDKPLTSLVPVVKENGLWFLDAK